MNEPIRYGDMTVIPACPQEGSGRATCKLCGGYGFLVDPTDECDVCGGDGSVPTVDKETQEIDEAIALELALCKVDDDDQDRAELSTIVRMITRRIEESEREEANAKRIRARSQAILERMVKFHYPRAEGLAREILARTKGKKKSIDNLWGTAGFKTSGGKLHVDDADALLDAVEHMQVPAEFLRTKVIREVNKLALLKWWAEEEVRYEREKADADKLAEETGEIVDVAPPIVPPGCHYEPKFEKFYIK